MQNYIEVGTIEKALHQWRSDAEIESINDVSGIAHSTYIINLKNPDGEVVMKFCPDSRFRDRFKVEPFVTDFIEERTYIPVPDIIFSDFTETAVNCPYYISEKIEGYNPGKRFKYLPKETKKQILFEAGKKLGELHREAKLKYFSVLNSRNGEVNVEKKESWPDAFREVINEKLEAVEKTPFSYLLPEIRNTIRANLSVIDCDIQPRLLHQDFRPGNILVKDGKITGVLDWEGALAGHKEYDLFKAEREFIDRYFENEDVKREYRNYFFNGYNQVESLEDGWQQRRKFYRFTYLIEALAAYPDWDEIYSDEERQLKQRKIVEKIRTRSLTSHDLEKTRIQIDAPI